MNFLGLFVPPRSAVPFLGYLLERPNAPNGRPSLNKKVLTEDSTAWTKRLLHGSCLVDPSCALSPAGCRKLVVPKVRSERENVSSAEASPVAVSSIDGDDPSDAADFLAVLQRLRDTLGERRGRIRVSDVQELAGLERPSYYRMNLIARALRHLGWRRTRCRFGGTLTYGYSRGTRLQREEILEIERREDGQVTLKEAL